MLTVAMVAGSVPPSLKSAVTQSLVDKINNLDEDPHMAAAMRDNFITYTSVLQEGKFKVDDYLSAVKFVSFLLMKLTKKDAWIRTFPERYQQLMVKGGDKKTISSHVAMYANGKLVNLILERSLVPFHVVNQDIRQAAVNKQYRLMLGASSEFVQQQAANSLLVHLTPPKDLIKTQINVSVGATSALEAMEAQLHQLVQAQKKSIEDRLVTTKTIAASSVVVDAVVEPA